MTGIYDKEGGGPAPAKPCHGVMTFIPKSAQFFEDFLRRFLEIGAILCFEDSEVLEDATFH